MLCACDLGIEGCDNPERPTTSLDDEVSGDDEDDV